MNYQHKPWLPFEEARACIRNLEFSHAEAFRKWTQTDERNERIPVAPNVAYRSEWVDWLDWLGKPDKYSRTKRKWLPFEEARDYVRSLQFSTVTALRRWEKTSDRLMTIPTNPQVIYPWEWVNWNDWIGKPQSVRCACGYVITANSRKAQHRHGIMVMNRLRKGEANEQA